MSITMRRSKRLIDLEILQIASIPVNKTRIMYGANLNYNRVNKYLDRLIKEKRIKQEKNKYETTEQGSEYIKKILAGYRRLS